MKQKALLFIVFSLLYCLPSRSVLKEKDLDNPLQMPDPSALESISEPVLKALHNVLV